jgi:hypothetical protein
VTAINPGDAWTLIPAEGLGTGVGSIPAGAQVTIDELLPPYSPGVCWTSDNTVVATYSYDLETRDANGNVISTPTSRILAYPEPDFLALFTPGGSG